MTNVLLISFIPEFFLATSILFQLIFNVKIISNLKYNYPIIDREVFYQTMFVIFVLFFLYNELSIEVSFDNYLFVNDSSVRGIKLLLISICFFTLNIIFQSFSLQKLNFFEYFTIFLLALLSALLIISSTDLLSFYLIIEAQSLCLYILANFKRDSGFSTEAGLKYFFTGIFISCIFLFGCTLIYGCFGSLNFHTLNSLFIYPYDLYKPDTFQILFVGVSCITITLLFKLVAAPFHFSLPDVYEGAPLSTTIIFSIVPKISIIYFFIK
jgi:NADH-quinone oxidoreductase subunit N